jgi:hypothetical protein
MNVELPGFSLPTGPTLEKYMPALLAIAVAWLFARGLKGIFWTAFGLYWAFHWMH